MIQTVAGTYGQWGIELAVYTDTSSGRNGETELTVRGHNHLCDTGSDINVTLKLAVKRHGYGCDTGSGSDGTYLLL